MNHQREESKRRRTRPSQDANLGLSESFHLRLTAYAMAAGAAGVGLLAAVPTSSAEIIFTPAHTIFTNGVVFIDLNHDGINDFGLSIYNFDQGDRRLNVEGDAPQNGVLGYGSSGYPPFALKAGSRIGPSGVFLRRQPPRLTFLPSLEPASAARSPTSATVF